jgi:hypothetical protein
MSSEVAIIGIGLHPFGRHDELSGRAQGALALRAALEDAGVSWEKVGVAYGGSHDAGNADALVKPSSMARFAASLMFCGVSKSGSPAPSPITSRPAAFGSRALLVTAMVGDGFTRASVSDRNGIFVLGLMFRAISLKLRATCDQVRRIGA